MSNIPEIPENFCVIKEPDNPDFDERFACKDCGENFVTLCTAARLKGRIATLTAQLAERDATIERMKAPIYAPACIVSEDFWAALSHFNAVLAGRSITPPRTTGGNDAEAK